MASLDNKISLCETKLSHTFSNRDLCAVALNMSSSAVIWNNRIQLIRKNRDLAVYGDAVLAASLCRRWYDMNLSKAQWTTIVQSVGLNSNVARVGFNHGLDACINRDPATPIVSEKMMAATVEAILGAVHLDGGDDALATVMEHLGLSHELLSQAVTFLALLSLPIIRMVYIPINVSPSLVPLTRAP